MACGPIPASLAVMPLAKSRAENGANTLANSLTRVTGTVLGIFFSAAVNSTLVEGVTTGAGGIPKFGGVVSATWGVPPMLLPEPSSGAFSVLSDGTSRLPALSAARARNSYL